MATYAIGDVQGCFDELCALLDKIGLGASDRLWFVGDLVNRGAKSLDVLRFVRSLGERAIVVLGNHDLHLVAQHEGVERAKKGDTLDAVLRAPDRRELVDWLRTRPLMHAARDYVMVHAGLVPQWSIEQALVLAREAEAALAGPGYREFLAHMYGSRPDRWRDSLRRFDRLRVIINAMTRLRFCRADGKMQFGAKGTEPPRGYRPWFEFRPPEERALLFGHWSALGLKLTSRLAALDSGCVWGGKLSALRLEDRALYQVGCRAAQSSTEE
jgi:bis(5'-nucleosyl)-tetraphosphatase (symmetrical)